MRVEVCCCLSVVHVFRIWVVAGGAAFVFEKKRRSGLQLQACAAAAAAAAPPATGGGGAQFIDVSKYSSECDRSRKMKGAGGCTRCGGAQLCVFPCETGAASLLAMTSNCMQTLAPPPPSPLNQQTAAHTRLPPIMVAIACGTASKGWRRLRRLETSVWRDKAQG